MKHLCVALIVITLVLCDLWSDTQGWTGNRGSGWNEAATLGLIFAGWWFYRHRDKQEK